MIENAIRSPLAERTIPERDDTFWIVPVFALRFPAAAEPYILLSSRGFPASGSVSQSVFQSPFRAI